MAPRVMVGFVSLLALAAAAAAQTYTASIRGVVTDPTQSAVPGAHVVATDTRRNIQQTAQTDGAGRYVLPNLPPGPYTLTVEARGFKKYMRAGFDLEVNQDASIDVVMQLGEVTESVSVTGEPPLLEATSSSVGKVIDNRSFLNLPFNTRNVYSLVFITPGAVGTVGINYDDMRYSVNGARVRMLDTLIDGVPTSHPTVNGAGGVSVFPSVDAIEEFKVLGANPPAEFGRSQGSILNVVFKSGTNLWHGSAYEFLRNSVLDANNFFDNSRGRKLASFKRSQFGGTLAGPVIRDKTFFLVDYEGLRERSLANRTTTVPTDLQRIGDFSQTFAGANRPVIIYNPFALAGGARQPFDGNKIPPELFDAVAANVIKYYPRANVQGDPFTNFNNYSVTGAQQQNLDQYDVRVDQNLSSKERFYARYSHRFNEAPPLVSFPKDIEIAEGRVITQNFAHGIVADYSNNLTPSTVLNARMGFARTLFLFNNQGLGFLPSSLGLPKDIDAAVDRQMFPAFRVSGYVDLGGNDHRRNAFNTWSALASLNKIAGAHTLKTGFEGRLLRVNVWEARDAGSFSFSAGMTQGPNPLAASATAGNSIASLLVGTGSGGNIFQAWKNVAAQSFYYAGYFQDDWRLTRRLTLNLGIRYDYDQPRTERYNRFNFFDQTAPSPIVAQVKAAPGAANCPACANLQGGLVFVGVNGVSRHQYTPDKNNWAPRLGLAYQVTPTTVIRAGYGHLFGLSPQEAIGTVGPYGFRVNNQWTTTVGGDGITPLNLLRNPFPQGFRPPPGASQGLLTQAGADIQAPLPDTPTPWSMQWNFTVQQELPSRIVLEVAYVGTRGLQLSRGGEGGFTLNQVPADKLALGNQLTQQVDNPFFGIVNNGPLTGRTVARNQLLRPYPQFTDVIPLFSAGSSSTYHALQVSYRKRLTHGFQFAGSYTWSKSIDNGEGGHQDSYYIRADRAITDLDQTHRFSLSYIYELPFGRGRQFGRSLPRPVDLFAGGWQVSGLTSYQSGQAIGISARNQASIFTQAFRASNNGKSAKLEADRHNRLDRWFDTSVFSQPLQFTLGNLGPRLPDVRNDGVRSWDLTVAKNFAATERLTVQFRAEFLNAFNTVRFSGPNTDVNAGASFGRVSTQANSPRQIQFGLKLLW